MSRIEWMAIRKRVWGVGKEAWIVTFKDIDGKRRLRTFKTKKDADKFAAIANAIASGITPEPITKGHRPLEFVAALPINGWRKGSGRESIAEAFRAAYPRHLPDTDNIILHVLAEIHPSATIPDVDNLLKPVMDALSGVAWVNDTQVCECLVRRVMGRGRKLKIRIWRIPSSSLRAYRNAIEAALPPHG